MSRETRRVAEDEYRIVDRDAGRAFGDFKPNALQSLMIAAAKHSFLRRGFFRKTMTRIILGVTGKPIDVMFRGCAFRLRGRNNLIEYGILLNPAYNAVDIEFLLDGMKEGDNFVDVGANIGLYSLPLAKRAGLAGKVVSVDANPLMAARLDWNAKASNLENVHIFSCAVSDTDGQGRLNIRKDDIAIVSVDEVAGGDIPVRTLRSVLDEAQVKTIHGLKIDIEGHEDKALVPFIDSAPDEMLPKKIVIEHPIADADYPGCTAAFARCGYRLVGRSKINSLYRLERSPNVT
ncbi:MAG: FkbM family methyltransferase [Hyphomicrobiales bacterium]|nr:FkbM family methyltransferase [Hyphomicrobiales bacterium]